jgi:hypothetical protein
MRFRWIGWDAVAAQGEGISRLLIFARGMRSVGEESEESLLILEWAHRATTIHIDDLSKLACFSLPEWHPCWPHCGRRARPVNSP